MFPPDPGPAGAEPVSLWLPRATTALAAAGVEQPAREARLLLAAAMGLTRAELLLAHDRRVPEAAAETLARRCRREPLALITGRQGFWTLDLAVSPATLIPRADTETVVEAAIELADGAAVSRILDLGTGTGCLLLALLCEFPVAWGVGVDCAEAAAALARRNAQACGLAARSAFISGDWAGAVSGRFDLVVSNPPYVARGCLAGLMPEVSRFEPARALDGGPDGLDAYRALLPELPRLLAPGGAAILEIGIGQSEAVATLAAAAGLTCVARRADLAGITRALALRGGLT